MWSKHARDMIGYFFVELDVLLGFALRVALLWRAVKKRLAAVAECASQAVCPHLRRRDGRAHGP